MNVEVEPAQAVMGCYCFYDVVFFSVEKCFECEITSSCVRLLLCTFVGMTNGLY